MKHRPVQVALLVATALLLSAGLYRLFELRFAAGDIFPPSSSRRADPIGSRALFDALARQPSVRTSRNLLPLDRLRASPGLALLVLGVAPEDMGQPGRSGGFNTNLLRLAQAGARVILAAQHESTGLATNSTRQGIRLLARAVPANLAQPSLESLLEFRLVLPDSGGQPGPVSSNLAQALPPHLPSPLPWPSPWRLSATSASWTTWYEAGDAPVVAQRPWGQGSIVLLASDYLLSNEGLRRSPQPGFLSDLVGPATDVVFDETHLGLTFEPGMASLVRRYQLTGAAVGLALLAALYLWRNFAPFNPPIDPPPPADVIPGRGSPDAFLALLRRALQPDTVVAVCLEHWRASMGRHPRIPARRIADAQDALDIEMERPPRERDPVGTYRRIAAILQPRQPR